MVNLANAPTPSQSHAPSVAAHGGDRSSRYFDALVETAQALNRGLDFFDLLELFLIKLMEVGQMTHGIMGVVSDSGDFQYVGGYDSAHHRLEEGDLVMPSTILRDLYENVDVIGVSNLMSTPTYYRDALSISQKLEAVLAFPILRGKRLIGVVFLANRTALPPFEPAAVTVLNAIVAQFSLAVDHAITVTEMATQSDSIEAQVQTRTEQLSDANRWLAENLRETEKKVANQKDEELRRTRMFSALVHELRAPMQLLIGHAWIAMSEGGPSMTVTQRDSLDTIVKSSEYVQELVGKILDVNKLEEGALTINPTPLDLRKMIIETLDMSRGLVKDKPVQMAYTLPDRLPTVLGDSLRIRQVLINLLANACHFTEKGKITVSAAEHKGYIIVGVADTGPGIPEDKLTTIFDPYIQVTTAHSQGGTGLGLTICKQLVELHGGQMSVKSTLNVGSVFFFSLPIVTF